MSWVVAVNRDEGMGKAYVGQLKTINLFEKISVCWPREVQQGCASLGFSCLALDTQPGDSHVTEQVWQSHSENSAMWDSVEVIYLYLTTVLLYLLIDQFSLCDYSFLFPGKKLPPVWLDTVLAPWFSQLEWLLGEAGCVWAWHTFRKQWHSCPCRILMYAHKRPNISASFF